MSDYTDEHNNFANSRNRNLGCKWFIFYSRVRPFISCFFFVPVIISFFKYIDVYISDFWLMLAFIGSVVQAVLCIMVFKKSFGNYIEFVRFIYGALLFETVYYPYSYGFLQNIYYGFWTAFIIFIITLIIMYFLWYKLNIKYFEKRISHITNVSQENLQNPEPYKSRFTECPECGYIAVFEKECPKCGYVLPTEVQENNISKPPPILYCRKCGAKLLEDARYCKECGTEIVTKVEERKNDMQ